MKVIIVIPTYNERENTEKMIPALSKIVAQISNHQLELLYIDANSPDGTAQVVKDFQKKYKWLHLLVETKKEGLGMAYAKAFAYASDQLKADYIMEFDSDFQHRPEDIPALIAQIDNGYDYIIGSRYISGGSIPREWGIDRKLLSVIGNFVARVLLLLPHIHDVTGGFKLSRVKGFIDEFDFNSLLSRSFAYKIHLLFYMVQKGAKIKEVPIQFMHRTSGESKIIKNELQETLRVIFLLQLHNPRIVRFLRFGTVGFIGYIFNALSLYLFTLLYLPGPLAWGLSAEIAIISNFTFNNLWTFKDKQITGPSSLIPKFLQFNLTSLGALSIQLIAGHISDTVFGPQYRQIALPVSIVFFILPYNYFMYSRVIWKTKSRDLTLASTSRI